MSINSNSLPCHVVIPDTQVKPGVPIDHLRWEGQFIVDQFAGRDNVTIIHLGDHWDMPSLSSYDRKGGTALEGRRIIADIDAGNEGFRLLNSALDAYNGKRREFKERQWLPRRVLLRGNHENRIERAVDNDAQLEGFLDYDLLKSPGWEVVPFLQIARIDGVSYSHYFYNPMTGRPYGGNALARLKTMGFSFVQGHQQVFDLAVRYVNGQQQRGLIYGANYLHSEGYLGPQGNAQNRGIVVLFDLDGNGGYSMQEIPLDYLCRRYEGTDIRTFLRDKYGLEYMA